MLKRLLYVVWVFSTSSGCGVLVDLTRKAVEQVEYQETVDELLVGARNRRLANAAWDEYRKANSECSDSKHYVRGFKQGFADYLDGGSGEPPVVPPRSYWKVFYQTPEGHEDVEAWFAGYRAGVIAAEQSGYRHWLTIPTSMLPYPNLVNEQPVERPELRDKIDLAPTPPLEDVRPAVKPERPSAAPAGPALPIAENDVPVSGGTNATKAESVTSVNAEGWRTCKRAGEPGIGVETATAWSRDRAAVERDVGAE